MPLHKITQVISQLLFSFAYLFGCTPTMAAAVDQKQHRLPSEATSPRQIADTPLTDSPFGNNLLRYTIECALAKGDSLVKEAKGGDPQIYQGAAALAPEWRDVGLSEEGKRWVSACIFARTNLFGTRVDISMREHPDGKSTHKALQATPEERKQFSLHEGAFFGNLFAVPPLAYVCTGNRSELERRSIVDQKRVCAEPGGGFALGLPVSRCGFLMVGPCSDNKVFRQNGVLYKERIHVFLKSPQVPLEVDKR